MTTANFPNDYYSVESALERAGISGGNDSTPELQLRLGERGLFQYIMVHLNDQDSGRIQDSATPIVESILRHKGRLWVLDCPLLLASFGVFGNPILSDQDGMSMQQAVIAEILLLKGRNARVIYGATEGQIELCGPSSKAIDLSPIIPSFRIKLVRLLTLQRGDVVEA